jgi:hypothetical protein
LTSGTRRVQATDTASRTTGAIGSGTFAVRRTGGNFVFGSAFALKADFERSTLALVFAARRVTESRATGEAILTNLRLLVTIAKSLLTFVVFTMAVVATIRIFAAITGRFDTTALFAELSAAAIGVGTASGFRDGFGDRLCRSVRSGIDRVFLRRWRCRGATVVVAVSGGAIAVFDTLHTLL